MSEGIAISNSVSLCCTYVSHGMMVDVAEVASLDWMRIIADQALGSATSCGVWQMSRRADMYAARVTCVGASTHGRSVHTLQARP